MSTFVTQDYIINVDIRNDFVSMSHSQWNNLSA